MIFEKLFEAAPDAVVVTDAEGQIVLANARSEQMFGYGREEMIGQRIELLVPARFREVHSTRREDYEASPHARPMGARLDLYGRHRDGSEFPVDIMLSPVETEDGRLVLSIIRDISDRKRAEEALRIEREQFKVLVEGVTDYAIFMLDADGHVTSWNGGAERIKGYKAGEIIGQHFSCFYTPEDIAQGTPEEHLRFAAARGRVEYEGWRVRKDGSQFWAIATLSALSDGEGKLRGFAIVTRDITESKRAREALLLEMTNVLMSNLEVGEFLSAISASLRQVTPHDFAGLALYEPERKKMRLHILTAPDVDGFTPGEVFLSIEDSPAGRAFTTREPVLLERLEESGFAPENVERWTCMGVRSACWLPLVSQRRAVGCLVVASQREAAFNQKDILLLRQVASQVAVAVDNALAFRQIVELKEKLREEKLYLEEELRTEYNFDEVVGESRPLKRILKQVETVAPTDATVLILGETGTGKELIARAIHNLSQRRERTFIKVNCAAIPSGLLESELFGHEKGAFTGAITRKIGRFELAHHGTIFLDEVGDIPLEVQPKLLRALQEKEFERLGSTATIPVDVRLVAATNRDLTQMVKEGEFRSDLYYRLRVFPLTVPPLRKRTEDIPILAHYFAQKHARRMNRKIETIPPESIQALVRWSWPGNVRELENLIERAVILSRGPVLQIPLAELKPGASSEVLAGSSLEDAERAHILRVLKETRGVIGGPQGAASRLGLKRTTLNFKMRKLGISRKDL